MRFRSLVLLLLTACASADSTIPAAWLNGERTLPSAQPDGLENPPSSDIRIERSPTGARLVRENEALTPEFAAIDSFSVSAERGEVAFSAKRKDNFDVGLVSTDGSP